MAEKELDNQGAPKSGGQGKETEDTAEDIAKMRQELLDQDKKNAEATLKASDAPPTKEPDKKEVPADKSGKPEDGSLKETTSLDSLQDKYNQLDKNNAELRKTWTQDRQRFAELRKQNDELNDTVKNMVSEFGKLSRKKVDPTQFMEKLKTQGPSALDEYFGSELKAERANYDKNVTELQDNLRVMEFKLEYVTRATNSKEYPDFVALEPKMNEIASAPDCPVDRNAPMGDRLDALYKLAVESSSGDAVKLAREQGKKAGEAQLAKEANSSVAGSGKSYGGGPVIDPHTMDLEKLRKVIGVADRD